MRDLTEILLKLEKKLMDADFRRDRRAADVIADDFIEFGSNGRVYDKAESLETMQGNAPGIPEIEQFQVRELAADVVLVTYRLEADRASLRSSIWVNRNGAWQITFHQGTALLDG